MKFSILNYQPMGLARNAPVPLGVVLQTSDKLLFRFDTSTRKFQSVKILNPDADRDTFSKLPETFKQNYVDGDGVVATSDDGGNLVTIKVTEPKFLDYLHNTFQNLYQYSQAREVQAPSPELALNHLFKTFVDVG